MFEITRARSFSRDVFYAAAMPEKAEAQEAFTRMYQYYQGSWDHADVKISTQRIIAYRRPEGGRIAVYMSHDGNLFSPEPSFRGGPIADESAYKGKRLGRLSDLRQVGEHLVACGEGGQNYKQGKNGVWVPIDLGLFDDKIDSNWVFSIKAQGNTGREQNAYWAAHPDLKNELDRRVRLYISNKDLHSINGPSFDELYISSSQGAVYFWNGRSFEIIDTGKGTYLTDILVDGNEVWICGRDGTLLRGNAEKGFTAVPCDGEPMLSKMTKFRGHLYLSSYANPRGVFVYDGQVVRRVASRLTPELDDIHTVDAGEDALWAIGSRDIARFDGTAWERVPMPK